MDRKLKGRYAEEMAMEYLMSHDFKILERNYRFKRSEIDLIAQKDDLIVFVEVKHRQSTAYGLPEETVSQNQKNNILQAAEEFIIHIDWMGEIRFDIIAISGKKELELMHFEDAF